MVIIQGHTYANGGLRLSGRLFGLLRSGCLLRMWLLLLLLLGRRSRRMCPLLLLCRRL